MYSVHMHRHCVCQINVMYKYVHMYICICFVCYYRNVTDSDIANQERRLTQTMDMITSKKKR